MADFTMPFILWNPTNFIARLGQCTLSGVNRKWKACNRRTHIFLHIKKVAITSGKRTTLRSYRSSIIIETIHDRCYPIVETTGMKSCWYLWQFYFLGLYFLWTITNCFVGRRWRQLKGYGVGKSPGHPTWFF
jgi:hypothetical protein